MKEIIISILLISIAVISCTTTTNSVVNNVTVVVENGYLLPYDTSTHLYRGRNFYKVKEGDIRYLYIDDVTYGQYQQITYGKMVRGSNGWFEKDGVVYGNYAFIGTYGEFIEAASQEIADYFYNGCGIRKDKTIIVSRRIVGQTVYYDDIEESVVGYFTDKTYKSIDVVSHPDPMYWGNYFRNDKP